MSRKSMRASIDIFFITLLLFFVLVALPRDPDSPLGVIGIAVDSFLETFSGGEMSSCPLLRRGSVINSFSDTSYPITAYWSSSGFTCSGNTNTADHVQILGSTLITIPMTEPLTCPMDNFINFDVDPNTESMLTDESGVNPGYATAECSDGSTTYKVCLTCTNCVCFSRETGTEDSCDLNAYIINTFLDEQAIKERDVVYFMAMDMPSWVCVLFFGILPFMLSYYFMNDVLQYTAIRPDTRKALSVTVGMVGVVTGALVGVTMTVVKFVRLTTNMSTLFIMIGIGFFSSFLMVLTSFTGSVSSAVESGQNLHNTLAALKRIGRDLNK